VALARAVIKIINLYLISRIDALVSKFSFQMKFKIHQYTFVILQVHLFLENCKLVQMVLKFFLQDQ
jgi:hypothetical protein